ncbi:hypothetical protein BpHYR1_005659 [Brachionus plicatilis]|uniref:Uncharacterized protein n=1 Tax=Brachionus plicatilis TaxID=10195 RepID=A0A3M7Q113_BRAPC|nr:hypothetical protein BpHYR1_005659 [Brachionus plicatilis]
MDDFYLKKEEKCELEEEEFCDEIAKEIDDFIQDSRNLCHFSTLWIFHKIKQLTNNIQSLPVERRLSLSFHPLDNLKDLVNDNTKKIKCQMKRLAFIF